MNSQTTLNAAAPSNELTRAFRSPSSASNPPMSSCLLSEGRRVVTATSFIDQDPCRPRVVPLTDLRDLRVATHQTRTHCVAVLALAFDHGVETFAVDLDDAPRIIGQLQVSPCLSNR